MNLLILGDVMGVSGRKALSDKLPDLIKTNKIQRTKALPLLARSKDQWKK